MKSFNKERVEAKGVYKEMLNWQMKNKPKDGVFCPSSHIWQVSPRLINRIARQLLSSNQKNNVFNDNFNNMDAEGVDLLKHFWGMHVLGAWRTSLGIYKLEAEMVSQMADTPIPDDTPTNIFSRLPEWCVYLEIPEEINFEIENASSGNLRTRLNGFWALFDYIVVDNRKEVALNLVPNFVSSIGISYECLQPLQIIIKEGLTIKEACRIAFSTLNMGDGLLNNNLFTTDYRLVNILLSLLLSLCAKEPDIINVHGEAVTGDEVRLPKYTKNKKTGAFIPPSSPTIYYIGKRLGGEIRALNLRLNKNSMSKSSRKRPHIRKAHWRGVWKGTGQNRRYELYWQYAVFVNGG